MIEQRSKRMEPSDVSRVDRLLGLLSGLSQHDPSPALRDRLELLAAQRLKGGVEPGKRSGLLPWLKPPFAVALLIAIGMVGAFVAHVHQRKDLQAGIEPRVLPPKESSSNEIPALLVTPSREAKSPKVHHPLSKVTQNVTSRRMVVQLPYSNSAIDTGTDTTIQVSMSQVELASLGFPINAALQDRRVVAELTLGDDGLPRAISVPLPLEVIREKK